MRRRSSKKANRKNQGAVLAEFALTVPVLILFVNVAIGMGAAFVEYAYTMQFLYEVARRSAQEPDQVLGETVTEGWAETFFTKQKRFFGVVAIDVTYDPGEQAGGVDDLVRVEARGKLKPPFLGGMGSDAFNSDLSLTVTGPYLRTATPIDSSLNQPENPSPLITCDETVGESEVSEPC